VPTALKKATAFMSIAQDPTPDGLTVRVLKYDGAEYRRWHARIARRDGSLIVLDAEFEYDVDHHLLGNIQRGTKTIEYYWFDCWYNVFRFLEDDGGTRLYYCNVSMPPTFEDDVLTYIDLDIDILVQPDFSYQVLDLEEFVVNAGRFSYSEDIERQARAAVDELIAKIETREFPFEENNL
jgi:protein associated with RNAse G/E